MKNTDRNLSFPFFRVTLLSVCNTRVICRGSFSHPLHSSAIHWPFICCSFSPISDIRENGGRGDAGGQFAIRGFPPKSLFMNLSSCS